MKKNNMVFKLCRNLLIINIIIWIIGVWFTEAISYSLGIALGTITSMLRVYLMEESIRKAVRKDSIKANSYMKAQYFLRYALSFVVLAISVLTSYINILGVAIGLLSLKPAAYIQGKLEPKVPLDGSIEFEEWEDDEELTDFSDFK